MRHLRTLVEMSIQDAGNQAGIMLNASVGLMPAAAYPNFRELYRIADQLMYEDKRTLKQTN